MISPSRDLFINAPLPIQYPLLQLFKPSKHLTIFDIGACECEDSIRYARLFPQAKIFAFEPLPSNAAKGRKLLAQYEAHKVRLLEFALSDESGMADFHVSSGNPPGAEISEDWTYGNKSSSLLPPKRHLDEHAWVAFKETISVKTIRGEQFCAGEGIERIDFIHLDVQGAELKVLDGIQLSKIPVSLIWLEVSASELYAGQPLLQEVAVYMKDNKFILYHLDMPGVQGDALFVHRSLLLRRPRALVWWLVCRLRNRWSKLLSRGANIA